MLYPTAVAMEVIPEFPVKIVYKGEMRRFPFAGNSFQSLNDKVLEVLGLDKLSPIVLKYRDEDNDLITITCDAEFKCALVPGKILRLEVIPKESHSVPPTNVEVERSVPPFVGLGQFPFFPRGPTGEPFGRPWAEVKQEMKKCKKDLSPDEWAAFKKAKEEHKRNKEHMRGFHKMAKKGRKHGFYPGMFGPHPHPHPHHGPRGGPHPHHFPGFHGPRFGGPHPHFGPAPHDDVGAPVPPAPVDDGVPPPPAFAPPFAPAAGFWPPHAPFFGGHPHHHHHHPHHHAHGEKLIARHVKDVTITDGTSIPASTPFVKTWRVRNEGQPWPAGCKLTYISRLSHGNDNMSGPAHVVVEGPVVANQEIEISVPLVAPSKPGRYTGYWKMCTPDDRKFGQRLWVSIVVPSVGGSSSDEDVEADRLENLVDVVLGMGFHCKRHRVFRLLQKTDGDVDKVCTILIAKQAKKDAKEAVKANMRMSDI